jgi:hypothetical protein
MKVAIGSNLCRLTKGEGREKKKKKKDEILAFHRL